MLELKKLYFCEIDSLSKYIKTVEQIKIKSEKIGNKADLLFRGQREDYSLKPKLARLILKGDIIKIEKLMLEEFRRTCVPFSDYPPSDNWDLLSLAQHHGLPTRLLDWTFNALVALWFAVNQEPNGNKKGIVWVLNAEVDDFRGIEEQEDPLSNKVTKIFRPKVVSKRISAQSSVFTVHKINEGGKIIQFNSHRLFKKKLLKIVIPSQSFSHIRKSLSIMGINHSTIFPDINGLCQHLQSRYSKLKDE